MATEDAVYRESSQFRLWSFSPGQLSDLRAQTNALAQSTIREARSRDGSEESGSSNGNGNGNGSRSTSADPSGLSGNHLPPSAFLSPADERQLLDFYTVELLRAGKFMEQPTDVQATAAVFFRRFYVTHSIMTYPPAALFKTALFFGAKAEGFFYHKLDTFAQKFPNTTAADILAGEFLLCQGIRFAFDVRHPFRALEGAIMELRRLADESSDTSHNTPETDAALDDNRIANAHRRTREILKFSSLVTDAYFHYTPSQIMLAALRLADRGLADRLIAETFRRRPEDSVSSGKKKKNGNNQGDAEWERIHGAAVRARVEAALAGCEAMLAAEPPERLTEHWGQAASNAVIKPLLKKLKACHDPDRWDLVALQQAKREGAVKSYQRNTNSDDAAVFGKSSGSTPDGGIHDAKRRKVAKPLEDPFGPAL